MRCHGRLQSARDVRLLLTIAVLAAGIAAVAALMSPAVSRAADPFAFASATEGAGSLSHIGPVPVLVVRGTPEQMGAQLGVLLKPALQHMAARQADLLGGFGMQAAPAMLSKLSALMAEKFPPDLLTEIKAAAREAKINSDFLLMGNVIYDVSKIGGCSVLLVDRDRSATGEILFGRNMDFPTFGFLDRCSLLVVYVPEGKHAFASVAFPGFFGCISGINDAGLAIAELEVNEAKDGSPTFTPAGLPLALCFRRLLEDCTTIDEAEKLLNSLPRTSMCNLAICDRQETAVLEITTNAIHRRKAEKGFCACTNHFRTPQLATDMQCERYDILSQAFDQPKLTLAAVARKLNEVNQGKMTIHTMIFEPASLRLHLVVGAGPVSAKPLENVDLARLFAGERATQPAKSAK